MSGARGHSGSAAVTDFTFPTGFVWGVSTSALQIEGGLKADGRGVSIWDDVKGGTPPRPAEPAADHYRCWREDVALLARLGTPAYRFSVAWPRVLPAGIGPVNPKGLDFYDELVDALLSIGAEPWVCLHHWDMPVPIQERGGWIQRDTVERFLDYSRFVVERLGNRVRHWIPLNEPNVVAYAGYGAGVFPPRLMNEEFFFDAVHNQNIALGRVFKELHRPGWMIGPVLALNPIRPASRDARDIAAANLQELVGQRAFLEPLLLGRYPEPLAMRMAPLVQPGDLEIIQNSADFIGVNYYGPEYRRAWPGAPFANDGNITLENTPVTEDDVVIDSQGLLQLLHTIRGRYRNPPVVITENGAAFRDVKGEDGAVEDPRRIAYLQTHLSAAYEALRDGCDLRGYFVWSLLDDWEWIEGYDRRYGLVHVDFDTAQRTPKASFDWYATVVRTGTVRGQNPNVR